MNIDKETYKKYTAARAPKSPSALNCLKALLCGGFICAFAQGLRMIYSDLCGMDEESAGTLTAVTLVFLAALLTGIGIFDNIARHAGAGTLVPITGFANAITSSAIDSRSEGFILGVGAKIFTVAGPVLLYGTLAGAIYGVIYFIVGLFA